MKSEIRRTRTPICLRDDSKRGHLTDLTLGDVNAVIGGAKRRKNEVHDDPFEGSGRIGPLADLNRHRHRLAVAVDDACGGGLGRRSRQLETNAFVSLESRISRAQILRSRGWPT